jgi:hypothetical protein
MSKRLERLWMSFLGSERFRAFAGQGAGYRFFRSAAYQRLNLARRYVTSYYQSRKNPDLFQDVRTYCMFIGHNKSGTSMIGALLDAHPNVILADEVGVLQFVPAGFSREQIFHLLLKGSRREAAKGRVTARRLQPYSYQVPGHWQGRYSRLQVIGDGTSGSSTRRLAEDPDLLQRLQGVMGEVDVKLIQVIRNPYDPITVSMVRGKRTFEEASAQYFAHCETLVELRKRLDDSKLFAVRYEDFVTDAERYLAEICRFLGVEAGDDYLKACTSILYKAPDQRRHMVNWDAKWIAAVRDKIEQYDFLRGYSFEETSEVSRSASEV